MLTNLGHQQVKIAPINAAVVIQVPEGYRSASKVLRLVTDITAGFEHFVNAQSASRARGNVKAIERNCKSPQVHQSAKALRNGSAELVVVKPKRFDAEQ